MKTVTATLIGISPYSQSKHYETEKLDKERPDDYEKRTWRDRCHVDEDGYCYIPPMALKNCLSEAAKFLSIQIPGKGKSTFTKNFEAGLMVVESMPLGVKLDTVKGEWYFVPADGRRGSGKRVKKCFPVFNPWKVKCTVTVVDETITKPIFLQHFEAAGQLIGMGRFRPRNNGFYGRFKVADFVWSEA